MVVSLTLPEQTWKMYTSFFMDGQIENILKEILYTEYKTPETIQETLVALPKHVSHPDIYFLKKYSKRFYFKNTFEVKDNSLLLSKNFIKQLLFPSKCTQFDPEHFEKIINEDLEP